MRILVFSNTVWDDTNATGNTLSNFFGDTNWKNDDFFNICIRDGKPNNKICKYYYQLLITDMIKNFFKKEKIGKECTFNDFSNINKRNATEKKIINFVHKYSLNFIYSFANFIYRKEIWLNDNFKSFVLKSCPDVFYAHVNNFSILYPIVKYVKNNTNAKIVLLLTDDLYNAIDRKSFFSRKKLKEEFKNIILLADKVYAISEDLQNEYSKIFNIKIDILYKGCSFEYPVKTRLNKIIKFVYAGNLLYGRDDVLFKVACAIDSYNNSSNQKAMLEIYTNSSVSDEQKRKLNIGSSSILYGKKDYSYIKKIMNDAEYNLHVESFEKKQIERVRYSFSTKIIDCLQSGSSILAIGPSNISSIKYLMNIPGTKIINNVDDIDKTVKLLVNDKTEILNNANIIRTYALKNHDIHKNQLKLRKDFLKLIKENEV